MVQPPGPISRSPRRTSTRQKFESLLSLGKSVDEARRHLELAGNAPARSTLFNWANAWRREEPQVDGSPAWTLLSDDTGRPALVLRILGQLYVASAGHVSRLASREAKLAVRIDAAAPELLETGPLGVSMLWYWTQRYRRATEADYPDLDLELALSLAK